MKKQRSNNKFLKIAAVSLALLALPPLAVYGQTVRCRAAQPRPALPGVMSDEIRLDPVAGALYRYGVQGGINQADSYWSDNVFTVLRGKLKQAATRGLLSREQLDYLLDRVAEGEAHAGPVQPGKRQRAGPVLRVQLHGQYPDCELPDVHGERLQGDGKRRDVQYRR